MDVLRPRASLAHADRTRSQTGFTLTEMLAALLVLTLLTGVVSTGVAGATDIYRKEQFASQSQVLAGTIYNSLSTPFRFMEVKREGNEVSGYTITYNEQISVSATDSDHLLISKDGRLYFSGSNEGGGVVEQQVLMNGAYGSCNVSLESFTCSDNDVEVKIKIADASAEQRYKEFEFHFNPLGKDYVQAGLS